jgi:hypothetical protein
MFTYTPSYLSLLVFWRCHVNVKIYILMYTVSNWQTLLFCNVSISLLNEIQDYYIVWMRCKGLCNNVAYNNLTLLNSWIVENLYNKINIISHVFHDKIKVLYIQYNTLLKVTVTILFIHILISIYSLVIYLFNTYVKWMLHTIFSFYFLLVSLVRWILGGKLSFISIVIHKAS